MCHLQQFNFISYNVDNDCQHLLLFTLVSVENKSEQYYFFNTFVV